MLQLWNEPGRGFFCFKTTKAAFTQYVTMWSRGFKRIRAALPDSIMLGPSIWGTPDPSNPSSPVIETECFDMWLDEVKKSNTMPNVVAWHVLSDADNDDYNPSPDYAVPRLTQALAERGLPVPPEVTFQVDEYGGGKAQAFAASSAWWMAVLDRYNMGGSREVCDACCQKPTMQCLLQIDDTTGDVSTTANWAAYNQYANMTGQRVHVAKALHQTAPFDATAVADPDRKYAAILLGQAQNLTGPFSSTVYNATITINGFDSAPYLVSGGNVVVTGLKDQSPVTMPVVNNQLTLELALGGGHAYDWFNIQLHPPA